MSEALQGILRLARNGRTRAARRLLAQEREARPDDLQLTFVQGVIAYEEDAYDEAREAFQEVIVREPDHDTAKHLLARVALETRAFSESERLLLEVLRRNPDDAAAYASYARLMMTCLHTEKARALAEESLRLDPHQVEAEVVVLLLDIMDGRRADVDDRMARMMRTRPDELHVVASLFVVLVDAKRHAEALEVGRVLLRHRPGDAELVEALVALRAVTHWTAWPLRPFARWGWTGSAVAWGIFVISGQALLRWAPHALGPVSVGFIGFVAYSWVWPPLLRKWLTSRGF